MASDQPGTAILSYRCLDSGHTFTQPRKPRSLLELRQSAWCWEHVCPAVLSSTDGTATGAPTRQSG